MLNRAILMGRLTAAPELKTFPDGTFTTSFSIAVERDYKTQAGERPTDFINIVAHKKLAEMICKYFGKGNLICIEGSINVRNYTAKDGTKRYVTEVVASKAHFTGEKRAEQTQEGNQPTSYMPPSYTAPISAPEPTTAPMFETLEDGEELPF